jgi:HPt (histidine-containing phosphotransfer) domain-containing protein
LDYSGRRSPLICFLHQAGADVIDLLDHQAVVVLSNASAEQNHPGLDAATIDRLRKLGRDDGTFLRALINRFRMDTEVRVAGLERAAPFVERAVTEALAHSLYGSSANIGATELAQCCRAIELLSAKDDASLYVNAVRRVRQAYERVLPLLETLL